MNVFFFFFHRNALYKYPTRKLTRAVRTWQRNFEIDSSRGGTASAASREEAPNGLCGRPVLRKIRGRSNFLVTTRISQRKRLTSFGSASSGTPMLSLRVTPTSTNDPYYIISRTRARNKTNFAGAAKRTRELMKFTGASCGDTFDRPVIIVIHAVLP